MIPMGVALNLALGTLAHALKVPLYLDAVGTVAVTLMVGLRAGVFVGVSSFLIGGLLVNPIWPFFIVTQAGIAWYVHMAARWGLFGRRVPGLSRLGVRVARVPVRVVLGIGLGVWAVILSTPVLVALFSGVTGNGVSLVVAFLVESGRTLLDAVLLSGLAAEPVDKTIQLLLALWLVNSLPMRLKRELPEFDRLTRNGLAGG